MGDLDAVARLREQLAQEIEEAEAKLKDLRRRYTAATELLTVTGSSAIVDNMDASSGLSRAKSLARPAKGLKAIHAAGLTLTDVAERLGVDKSLLSRALRGERNLKPAIQAELDRLLTK